MVRRPDTIAQHIWDTLTPKEQAFFVEHETMHTITRQLLDRGDLSPEFIFSLVMADQGRS